MLYFSLRYCFSCTSFSNCLFFLKAPHLHAYISHLVAAAGESVSPLLAQYGAAKSYISMFSKALNGELQKSGVHVQCQVRVAATAAAFFTVSFHFYGLLM